MATAAMGIGVVDRGIGCAVVEKAVIAGGVFALESVPVVGAHDVRAVDPKGECSGYVRKRSDQRGVAGAVVEVAVRAAGRVRIGTHDPGAGDSKGIRIAVAEDGTRR